MSLGCEDGVCGEAGTVLAPFTKESFSGTLPGLIPAAWLQAGGKHPHGSTGQVWQDPKEI